MSSFKARKEKALQGLECCETAEEALEFYERCADDVRYDKAVTLAAVKMNGMALYYSADLLRSDR